MPVSRMGRVFARLVVLSLCIGFFYPLHASAASPLVIGEVAWAGSSLSTADEWLELWNVSDAPIPLTGYRLLGAGGGDGGIVFRPEDTIAAHSTFLIANYSSTDTKSALDIPPSFVTSTISLSNDSLKISLIDPTGSVVDLAGSGHAPFAGTSTHDRVSMIRRSPEHAGDEASSWFAATTNYHLKPSTADLGTPGICDQCTLLVNVPAPETATPTLLMEENPVPTDTATDPVSMTIATEPTISPPTPTAPSPVLDIPTATQDSEPQETIPASTSTEVMSAPSDLPPAETPSSTALPLAVTSSSNTIPVPEVPQSTTSPVSVTATSSLNSSSTASSIDLTSPHTTTTLEIAVPQTTITSNTSTTNLHIQLVLNLNPVVTIAVPTQDHHEEYLELIRLMKTLLTPDAFQMTALESDDSELPTINTSAIVAQPIANNIVAKAVKKVSPPTKKTSTTKAAASKKTTTKKKAAASKSTLMSTTISAAPTIAQDAPHVFLVGTVASPAQLLGKNQFVIQAPDGRGLLVQGNGKQSTPALHQTVRVEGTLISNDAGLSLRMHAADQWSVAPIEERGEPRIVDLLAPSTEDEWSLIEVTGTVANVTKQSVMLDLTDTTMRARIQPILGYRVERLIKGDTVRIRGLLSLVRGETEIYPRSASEITLVRHASSTLAQASTTPHQVPSWAPIGAAGASIAATQGVRRLQKAREQRRLNNMLVQAQEQLLSDASLPSIHSV